MVFRLRPGSDWLCATLLSLAAACCLGASAPPQAAYVAENAQAMDRMMAAMHAPSTGDVDRDFALMMIPHHQAAIDMAKTELKYGRDESLKRLAQEIVVAQGQEIEVMRRALGSTPASSAPGADH